MQRRISEKQSWFLGFSTYQKNVDVTLEICLQSVTSDPIDTYYGEDTDSDSQLERTVIHSALLPINSFYENIDQVRIDVSAVSIFKASYGLAKLLEFKRLKIWILLMYTCYLLGIKYPFRLRSSCKRNIDDFFQKKNTAHVINLRNVYFKNIRPSLFDNFCDKGTFNFWTLSLSIILQKLLKIVWKIQEK